MTTDPLNDSDGAIEVCIERTPKIGDTLCILPWALSMISRTSSRLYITGAFSKAVPALFESESVVFREQLDRIKDHTQSFRRCIANIKDAHIHAARRKCHICLSFFDFHALPRPALPLTLPFRSSPCGLPKGIVVSPFSGSDSNHNKLWWPERWRLVFDHLAHHATCSGLPIYVVGTDRDDWSGFDHDNAVFVRDETLPFILDLTRTSHLVITIDNGISHLAHFGGVSHHLLLYPKQLSPDLVRNPRGIAIRAEPMVLSVEMVTAEIDRMLSADPIEGMSHSVQTAHKART